MSTSINKPRAHIVENPDDFMAAVVSKVNMVENSTKWIVDTDASKHFCANRETFTKFERVTEDNSSLNKCEICVEAKSARPSLNPITDRKTDLFDLVHTDLADFRNTESKNGKCYYITSVDDYSRYTKARLVVKEFTQKFGVDYFDTYSYVTKISTIHVLFALAFIHNLLVHQLDVKLAFLNNDLDEEIYIEQPPRFVTSGMEDKVCRLKKSLYGLKQAPKQLYEKFHKTILSFSFMIIGSLMFLMNYTQPDIAYAVSRLSRYTHNPNNEHRNALKHLLKYLKGILSWELKFVSYPVILKGYCDANWVTDNKVCSTSGYVFTLGGATISWKSGKQICIARSAMESEFIALDLAGQEAEWLRNLLAEIPSWEKSVPLISLLCDSQATIFVAKSQAYNVKKRHIRIRHESLRHLIKNGVLALDYVRSERNLVDPLTKRLSRKIVLDSSRGISLKPSG
ncbi:Retrovirus-related Pol polyprotein from transposon TNT 1-94 [Gossypium australe]|uniref:Retrovirus-related Pol polyprotein from transposon TNT 1-94 n=1 Tax=Gossypium australe TaxID=47621 RepID=A0A5B6VQE9_9ROSI|nr:Retrovirus-related Pol polyprotein from transposon TNT 1-94 [Gossypium australe]